MSLGDFTKEIPKELLHKTDEFGEISKTLDKMKNDVNCIRIFQHLYVYAK